MQQVAAGDDHAFGQILSEHLDAVHHYLVRLVASPDTASDLAQETFLRLWLKAGSFRPGRVRLTTWLHRIAHNLGVDWLRKAQREPLQGDLEAHGGGRCGDDPGASHSGAGHAQSADPLTQQQLAERRQKLRQALDALPVNQRSAVILCHQQGFSNAEAAAILGLGVRALESLLARARRRLREFLLEALPESGTPGERLT